MELATRPINDMKNEEAKKHFLNHMRSDWIYLFIGLNSFIMSFLILYRQRSDIHQSINEDVYPLLVLAVLLWALMFGIIFAYRTYLFLLHKKIYDIPIKNDSWHEDLQDWLDKNNFTVSELSGNTFKLEQKRVLLLYIIIYTVEDNHILLLAPRKFLRSLIKIWDTK